MGVRVRFAPSPTGLLHLGGARTALFNYLFAAAHKGQCILRIEDTDQARLVPRSRERLEETLQWLGVHFYESPSKGGPYGPYVQSERLPIYQQYARELLNKGGGYPCFCSKERLQSLRGKGLSGYDRRCREISSRQANEEMNRGTPFTVRLKVPEDTVVAVEDAVYGRVEVNSSTIEDQVLLKTDGFPTYHLASVVDDHCMEISHVLRGEEWLLSTTQHCLLYSSLGWTPPLFAHLPLLVSRLWYSGFDLPAHQTAHPVTPYIPPLALLTTSLYLVSRFSFVTKHWCNGEKLSKRLQGTSVQSYRERGFLSEAVAEFLCQLGWSGGVRGEGEGGGGEGGRSLEELAAEFSLTGISRSPARVDEEKLMWINKKHFRRRLADPTSSAELTGQLAECVETALRVPRDSSFLTPEYLFQVLQLLEDRIPLIPRVPIDAPYFWSPPSLTRESIPSPDIAAAVLEEVSGRLQKLTEFSQDGVATELKGASAALGVSHKVTMQICRAAIVGQEKSPSLASVCSVLGQDQVLDRLTQTAMAVS